MPETSTAPRRGDVKSRLLQKALMPVVATAASAAASYVAKKGPAFFESTVLPKLKEAFESGRETAASTGGDVVQRAKTIAGSDDGGHAGTRRSVSSHDLEQRLAARARSRAARQRSSKS